METCLSHPHFTPNRSSKGSLARPCRQSQAAEKSSPMLNSRNFFPTVDGEEGEEEEDNEDEGRVGRGIDEEAEKEEEEEDQGAREGGGGTTKTNSLRQTICFVKMDPTSFNKSASNSQNHRDQKNVQASSLGVEVQISSHVVEFPANGNHDQVSPLGMEKVQTCSLGEEEVHVSSSGMEKFFVYVPDVNSEVNQSNILISRCNPENVTSPEPFGSRVRLICSFGGRIMPRPIDRQLRYVGGETRIITIHSRIRFSEFMHKMSQFYGFPLGFKYQLPGEDLDALVSVSSDDDMQNMMEEYSKFESRGNMTSRIRLLFFSSPSDIVVGVFLRLSDSGSQSLEQQFVDAINGVQSGVVKDHVRTNGLHNTIYKGLHRQPNGVPTSSHRLFEGVQQSDTSGGFSTVVSYNGQKLHHEYLNGASISHLDYSVSGQGMHSIDPSSSINYKSAQYKDYRTSLDVSMDYLYDIQQSLDVHVSQMEHQKMIQRNNHVSLQLHHHHNPQHNPLQVPYSQQTQVNLSSGACEHQTQYLYEQAHTINSQHYYPSHHHVHHMLNGHDKASLTSNYHTLQNLCQHVRLPYGHARRYAFQIEPPPDHNHCGRCFCGLLHSQIHRGVSVCINEQSTSKRSGYVRNQTVKKHNPLSFSRFCAERSNLPHASMHPHLFGTIELGEQVNQWHPLTETQSTECWYPDTKNETFFLSPEGQETCQGIGCFDNEKQPKSTILVNPHYPGKQDQMNEWFMHQEAFEMESERVGKCFPNDSLPKDEGNQGRLMDEKCIDGRSVLYRSSNVQRDTELMTSTTHVNGIHATQGIECNTEWGSSTTSVRMSPCCNLASFEQGFRDFSLHHLQVNNAKEIGNEILAGKGDKTLTNSTVILCKLQNISMVQKKSVYDKYKLEFNSRDEQSDDKCEAEDMSTPSEVADVETAMVAVQRNRNVNSMHIAGNVPSTSSMAVDLDGASPTLIYDENVSKSNTMSDLQSISAINTDTVKRETFTSEIIGDMICPAVSPEGHLAWNEVVAERVLHELESNNSGSENYKNADLIDLKNPLSCVMKEHGIVLGVQIEHTADVKSGMEFLCQEDDSLKTKQCENKTEDLYFSEPKEEARAYGLQIINNADLEDFTELSSGIFWTVYHGKWRGTDVTIKRIKSSCFAESSSEKECLISDFWKEACTLAQLHHPNIVSFYGVVPDGPDGILATVTEYMINGSLKHVLQKKDRTVDCRKRLSIAMDAAFGMEYLHSKNIVHFDLKSENLLVNMKDVHRPICKVGDFGLSKVKHQTLVSGGIHGTVPWMAPELLSPSPNMVSDKIDVYSFGVVMWEILTGELPYSNMQIGAIICGILDNTLRPSIPSWCDPGWKQLMERCWSHDPSKRPSFAEVALDLRAISASISAK